MNGPGTRYRHRRPREEHGPAAALHISRCCGACGAASFGYGCASIHGMRTENHHSGKPGTVTVAGKPSIEIPPGTLNSILKQAGLKK